MKRNDKMVVVSNEDQKLVSRITERLEIAEESRRPFEQRWIINLAFLVGRQYIFYNQAAHTIQQLRKVKGRIRNVDNKLISRWRRQVADLIKNDPIMSVVPSTNEDEDIKAAKIGNKVMKAFWRSNGMKKKQRILAAWIFATGNGFIDDRREQK